MNYEDIAEEIMSFMEPNGEISVELGINKFTPGLRKGEDRDEALKSGMIEDVYAYESIAIFTVPLFEPCEEKVREIQERGGTEIEGTNYVVNYRLVECGESRVIVAISEDVTLPELSEKNARKTYDEKTPIADAIIGSLIASGVARAKIDVSRNNLPEESRKFSAEDKVGKAPESAMDRIMERHGCGRLTRG